MFIISFNRLLCLEKLLAWLESADLAEPIIIDNGSSYEPLLDWFSTIRQAVTIHQFDDNYGPYRVWEQRLFERYTSSEQPFYVVTDPDVVPLAECPKDAIPRLVDAWNDLRLPKVGLSLRVEAIPATLPHGDEIRHWENSLQCDEILRPNAAGTGTPPRCYRSLLDTTFQVNHRDVVPPSVGSPGIRLAHPYQADHLGWQLDPRHLSAEEKFYWQTASRQASTIQTMKSRGLNADEEPAG